MFCDCLLDVLGVLRLAGGDGGEAKGEAEGLGHLAGDAAGGQVQHQRGRGAGVQHRVQGSAHWGQCVL